MAKAPGEGFFVHLEQGDQIYKFRDERLPQRKALFRGAGIVRANHLADIASENPGTDFFFQIPGDDPLVFNGQVADAACGFEGAVGTDAAGGAGFDAALAGTAQVPGKGLIQGQIQVCEDFRQKEV